ncbi:MAG: dTMP kinase [Sulfolobales archaeon]
MSEGILIVIEGIDGAGKTSVSKEVTRRLEDLGFKAIYTYEPYTQFIVNVVNEYWSEIDPVVQTLLMAADRYYHISKVILPYMSSGYVVISDRYYYSSLAYQGAQGVDLQWILDVNKFVVKPKLAVYLDVDPEVGLKRKKLSTTRIKGVEADIELIKRARKIYLDLVSRGELLLIDGRLDLGKVVDEVMGHIFKLIRGSNQS